MAIFVRLSYYWCIVWVGSIMAPVAYRTICFHIVFQSYLVRISVLKDPPKTPLEARSFPPHKI